MAATALIVLDQGGPGPAGQAFEGTLAGGAVTVTNDDDTDVSTFTFTMLDVPPGSAVATGVMATGAPPSTASFTPDVPGSYRVQLEVTDGTTPDVDIRCFGVRNARGVIIPPYQRNPDPKPLPGSGLPGAKPDEQNYGGQARGWAGDRSSGQLEQFFLTYDDLQPTVITSTPYNPPVSNGPPLIVVDLATIGGNAVVNLQTGARTGQPFRIQAVGGTNYTVTVNMPPGHTINGETDLVILDGGGETFVFQGGTLWVRVGATVDNRKQALPTVMSSTPFTMLDGVAVLKVQTSTIAGPSIVNLAARSFPQEVTIIDEDGDANQYPITVVAPGGETINGNVNIQIHEKYGRVRLYYDGGTEWFVLSYSGGAFDTNRILTGQLFS